MLFRSERESHALSAHDGSAVASCSRLVPGHSEEPRYGPLGCFIRLTHHNYDVSVDDHPLFVETYQEHSPTRESKRMSLCRSR